MKFRLLIFILTIFVLQNSIAQTTQVHLSILKNTDSTVATASLYSLPDTQLITQKPVIDTVTFNTKTSGQYLLRVSATGKKMVNKTFKTGLVPLNISVTLVNDASQLDVVVVVAKKPFIKQDGDKTVVDAEPLATTSTNAYEVLEKTPGAVLIDGNVFLNSTTPAVIQINGREVKMSADEVSALLKNLPANSVIKIEVLRTPSAKFDASASGGIINIVLKKGVRLGTSGSANAEYSQGKYANFGTGFSLNNNTGKLKTSISYQLNRRKNFEDLSSSRFLSDSVLRQHAYTKYPSLSHFANLGADYEFSKKLTAGYSVRLSFGNNNNSSTNDIGFYVPNSAAALTTSLALTKNQNRNANINNDLDVTLKLDSAGSQWKNELNYNINSGRSNLNYENILITPFAASLAGNGLSEARRYYFSWQSDLEKKTKYFTIETGLKLSFNKQNNDADFFLQKNGSSSIDSNKTVLFRYRENIHSLYFQIAYKLKGLTIKPGLRLEHTNINGSQFVPFDTNFSIKRTDLFPYLYLNHRLFKIFGMDIEANAIFRKSISRPGYSALNPTPVYVDQFVYNIGNPKLTPQFTSNYEFNITAAGYPVFSIGKNEIRDIFNQVVYQDTTTKIIYNTYDNLGRNNEFYVRGMAGIPPGKKYFFYMGAQHNYFHYDGLYQQQPFNFKNGSWLFFMYQELKATKTTKLSAFGFYRLRSAFNFYQMKPFGMVNLSVNQSVLKKKANVVISVNDIFRTMRFDFTLQQPGINATGLRFNDSRRLTLKFIYNFGIKPKQENRPGFDLPAEGQRP